MKYLIAVLMMGLLAACDLGAASPSEEPLPSVDMSMAESMDADPSEDADASMDADESADADASDGGEMGAAACEEAWQSIDLTGIETAADLDEFASEIDETFGECETLSDWRDLAEDAIPNLDVSELEAWAAARCSMDDTLSQSPVCVEINS